MMTRATRRACGILLREPLEVGILIHKRPPKH